jgi:N-acetylmuramoyl-L-alanine amidase
MAMFTRIARPLAVIATVAAVAAMMGTAAPAAAEDSAESIYSRALGRERELRDDISGATLGQLRAVVRNYETLVRRFPRSGYCDNALWQGGNLAMLIFERYDKPEDRQTAVRLLKLLRDGYSSSPFRARAAQQLQEIDSSRSAPAPPAAAPSSTAAQAPAPQPLPGQLIVPETTVPKSSELPAPAPVLAPALPPSPAPPVAGTIATIKEIRRVPLPDGVRVSIELDAESIYRHEQLEKPRRVFFDLKGARTTTPLQDAVLKFEDDVVREIRLGRHPQNTTRIVMDMESVEAYTVFTLYNPFRLIVDFKRAASAPKPAAAVATGGTTAVPGTRAAVMGPALDEKPIPAAREPVPLVSRPAAAPATVSPTSPTANSNGQFSLARQLGLGISRIVLDAGHGGHDPGARGNGISEAELVLDVTLRLRDLLEKQPGIEVTLTRSTDEFIQLEERTAIANRTGADLFLSIHANASRNPQARGIETYFLNFASNPEAEAVAARENSASGKTMHSLPEIVRAIALNNKIDESRDFADMVQKSMVRRLSSKNRTLRDLGVKQAPFVVLIGAGMPSVLAEISFITNRQDGTLLKSGAYRQQIAESLFDAIVRYQRSLKGARAVASAKEE